jgi:hypothetical protein
VKKRFLIALSMTAIMLADSAAAGSIGDFFKALGNSIAHPGQHPKAKPRNAQNVNKGPKTKGTAPEADYPPAPAETPIPTATPTQPPIRVASVPAQSKSSKRDIPYAIPVPNKPGFVTSPYAPKQGLVDVRGFPSGTEVKDPYTGKIFLTP